MLLLFQAYDALTAGALGQCYHAVDVKLVDQVGSVGLNRLGAKLIGAAIPRLE